MLFSRCSTWKCKVRRVVFLPDAEGKGGHSPRLRLSPLVYVCVPGQKEPWRLVASGTAAFVVYGTH